MSVTLTTEERIKFAAYLEGQAESIMAIMQPLEVVGPEKLVAQYKAEYAAYKIVAQCLKAVMQETVTR